MAMKTAQLVSGIKFLPRLDEYSEGPGAEVAFARCRTDTVPASLLWGDNEHVGTFCSCASRILQPASVAVVEVDAKMWRSEFR